MLWGSFEYTKKKDRNNVFNKTHDSDEGVNVPFIIRDSRGEIKDLNGSLVHKNNSYLITNGDNCTGKIYYNDHILLSMIETLQK